MSIRGSEGNRVHECLKPEEGVALDLLPCVKDLLDFDAYALAPEVVGPNRQVQAAAPVATQG
jgi:hypothetical protein